MTLSVNDFEIFHQAVHGRAPFNWQSRLLRHVMAEQRWPRVLDIPTGAGKTTCIDIALFALALDAEQPAPDRWCPRRIAMIVDRRVVVDQAAERGRALLYVLEAARQHTGDGPLDVSSGRRNRILGDLETDVLRRVASALGLLSDADSTGEPPLGVFTLRGGIPKDDGWTRTPDQPLILASTVDQLGSRLLIQGYGVSSGMRPVHAGLVGNDTLVLLDEVHLSQPFKETLERLDNLRTQFADTGLPQRFQFAFLSATPGEVNDAFRLEPEELLPDSPLGARLYASKPARIVKESGRPALATRVVREALEFLKRHTVVVAVVNRVDTALTVYADLKDQLGADAVVLLTGRMRPLDRDDVLASLRPRIATGARTRSGDEKKLVVVGTQCIEAGADFDFDAMVTESTSFDGLRQRFGRVDRLGAYRDENGKGKAEGVIVHDKDSKVDPIYEETIVETVKWLEAQVDKKTKTVDFGSRSLLEPPPSVLAPKPHAPTLLPAYLDLWCQTDPMPSVVPDPGLFLHGPQSGPEDVQVVWRADLDAPALASEDHVNVVAAVAAIPPSSLESISLPFVAARRWFTKQTDVLSGAADVEVKGDEPAPSDRGGRRVLRWCGEKSRIVDASQIQPGDTLVVPSSYGGIDEASRCFNPNATDDVPDIAERAALMSRGRPLLRLHPRVLAQFNLHLDREDADAARDALRIASSDWVGWRRLWAESLAKGRKNRGVAWNDAEIDGWIVLEGKRVNARTVREQVEVGQREHASVEEGVEFTTDEEESAYVGAEVLLQTHTRNVEMRARDYARRLGLSNELINDVALAAWLHDIGKADPRFQRLLRGGSEIAYYRDEHRILAKSARGNGTDGERQRTQVPRSYPRGGRHEVQSLAMLDTARNDVAAAAKDIDLVMHLVASHHGCCRPFAPAVEDVEPVDVRLEGHASDVFGTLTFAATSAHGLHRLDSSLADRFWSLIAKYGWLELCWLEAILRLADHRVSEAEANGET